MSKKEIAMAYFKEGYNCAQAVAVAFADELGMEKNVIAKAVSGFGGGMGRLREVCGSVSGMVYVISNLYGYDDPKAGSEKMDLYQMIQDVAHQFEEMNGSVVCRELLGLTVKEQDPKPEARTNEYYKKRPCVELVGVAAEIVEKYIAEK
ncbi:MAG: C-GCAxxG-C-C family protein [Agathobacter sp.]|nr:C-GCAxxG-C-C family protein [Agathobacter sp.]